MRGITFPKKASLQLSVNAIVVLVLAITMLGLGLAFTKSKFSELGEKIEVPEPNYPATPDDPIVLAVNEIGVKSSKDAVFTANFYNEDPAGYYQPCLDCGTPAITTTANSLIDPVWVPSGDYETFRIVLRNMGTLFQLDSGSHVCTLKFYSKEDENTYDCPLGIIQGTMKESKQIVLKVS